MRELNEEGDKTTAGSGSTSNPTGLKSASSTPGTPAEKVGSDEDTVLVEGGGPATSGSASAKGALKKRKGKK